MRIFYFSKNMLQFLPIALPLEIGVLHILLTLITKYIYT
jgi:hypothetical protein